jgi:hypothetical protein
MGHLLEWSCRRVPYVRQRRCPASQALSSNAWHRPRTACPACVCTTGYVPSSRATSRRSPFTRIAAGHVVPAAPPAPPNTTIAEPRRPTVASAPHVATAAWGALPQSPYSLRQPRRADLADTVCTSYPLEPNDAVSQNPKRYATLAAFAAKSLRKVRPGSVRPVPSSSAVGCRVTAT